VRRKASGTEEGDDGESSRFSLFSVGIKKIRPAPGAGSKNLHMILSNAGFYQLPATDRPQIKVIFPYLEPPEVLGEIVLVPEEFTAAGSQGGTNSGTNSRRPGGKILFHAPDRLAEDIPDVSPPSAMDHCDNIFLRIIKDNALAIG
jgi:hypothetical protein